MLIKPSTYYKLFSTENQEELKRLKKQQLEHIVVLKTLQGQTLVV